MIYATKPQQNLLPETFYLSVNIAAQQFLKGYGALQKQLSLKTQELEKKGIPPFIQLEITEGVLINPEYSAENGPYKISIDSTEFGAIKFQRGAPFHLVCAILLSGIPS